MRIERRSVLCRLPACFCQACPLVLCSLNRASSHVHMMQRPAVEHAVLHVGLTCTIFGRLGSWLLKGLPCSCCVDCHNLY